jgi:hypothetical protein
VITRAPPPLVPILSQFDPVNTIPSYEEIITTRKRERAWTMDPLRGTMLQAGRPRVRSPMRSSNFPFNLILPAVLWPGVDPASNRNEYQESS